MTEELQTEAFELSRIIDRVFTRALSRITDHGRALLHWSLKSAMATVAASTAGSTTGSAWMTEQHSAVRDQALTGFPLQRYTARITNTLQASNVETLAPSVLTSSTLREMDVTEINDLLMITESITTVRANCEEQKNTAVSPEWLPTTLIPGSMTDGLFGLRYTPHSSKCNQLLLTECTTCETHCQLESTENG